MSDAPKNDVSEASGSKTRKVAAPTQPPTGLRDLYPAELNRLRFIQQSWRETSIAHGFEEIDGPTFEDADLYAVKSGEGILNECFGVFSGKNTEERARLAAGGNAPYALRPEFTPTLARMYAARAGALPKPTKWFWTQNCFRAERPQRGRLREFYQWNCDIIGLDAATKEEEPRAQARADAECIATCVGLLELLGVTPQQVRVKVNHRGVVRAVFARLVENGQIRPDAEPDFLSYLDELKKLTKDQRRAKGSEIGLAGTALDMIIEMFAGSSHVANNLDDLVIKHPEFRVLLDLREVLSSHNLLEWCDFDLSIVRGLAYYTGMVFEVHEASGAERAIAGGGRYDNLIELFGGPPTPAVGFGMGDVVLSLVLQDKGLMPSDDQIAERLGLRPDAFVISNGTPEADAQVAPTLAALRQGSPTRRPLHARRSYKTTKNVGKLIQDAAKSRARFCVIIESGTHCTLKNLDTQQEEKNIPLGDVRSRVS